MTEKLTTRQEEVPKTTGFSDQSLTVFFTNHEKHLLEPGRLKGRVRRLCESRPDGPCPAPVCPSRVRLCVPALRETFAPRGKNLTGNREKRPRLMRPTLGIPLPASGRLVHNPL